MFKWLRGFFSGIMLTTCGVAVGTVVLCVWLESIIHKEPERKYTTSYRGI